MSIYDLLNTEQKQAVECTEGPLLILAGAGSGKTRVLVHRMAYLIDNCGVMPYNILAITFTNKAAGEMRERVNNLIGFGADQIWVSTFHSTCVRILRRHVDLLGYDTNFTIYDTDDSKTLMKQVLKNLNIDPKQLKEKRVMNAISAAKDELVGVDEYESDAATYEEKQIALCYREYQKLLKNNNALDFDDLIVKTVELFKQSPEVLENYQERFKYIMVDEYQDTNTAQYELVHLLAKKYRNLCVVGDDDQSIYKFRGANIRNILDFEKHFSDATVIKLEQNYRSTQNILDAANAVISNNAARKVKRLWTDKGEGDLILFKQFDSAYDEAEFIADDIAKAAAKGKVRTNECAVLYRTNAQSRVLEEQFVRGNIPYNIVGGINFYDRKEIKDLLAYLRLVDNAKDDLQVKRVINIPKRGIGQTSIDRVDRYAYQNNMTFFEACENAESIPSIGAAAKKIQGFVDLVRVFKASAPIYGLRGLISDIIEKTGYVAELEQSEEDDAKDRIENIYELVNKIAYFVDNNEDGTLSDFLEEVALISAVDDVDSEDEKTLLMTLHAAKGLEFKRVYIAGCEDGVFPSNMTLFDEDPEGIEEERRLAYVGITRAMENLTITCARSRMNRGEIQYNPVSRFVKEIPDHLIDGRMPKERRVTDVVYQDDSYEKSIFKSKPSYVKPKATFQKGVQKADSLEYGIGDRVSHVKYGEGEVINIEDDPRDYKVTVVFDGAGQKIMYAMFAKLKKL